MEWLKKAQQWRISAQKWWKSFKEWRETRDMAEKCSTMEDICLEMMEKFQIMKGIELILTK